MQPTITLFLSFENGARYLLTLVGSPVCVDYQGFPVAPVVKNPPARAGNVRDLGPSLGREDPGKRAWPALQNSCLENPVGEEPGGLQAGGRRASDTAAAPEPTH